MPSFHYKALSSTGAITHGQIEAATRNEAYRVLNGQKLRPIQITAGDEGPGGDGEAPADSKFSGAPNRMKAAAILLFTEELADLLDSGVQLEPALRIIESRKEQTPIKSTAGFLRQQLREGKSLSQALRMCGSSFSELYVNMVAAGEMAGALNNILRRQAQYMSVIIDLQKRLTMALIYPCIVFAAGILLMVIFMVFLLPQLTSLLTKTGKQLPLVTRLLIDVSGFFGSYWWAMLAAMGATFLLHRAWVKTPPGRKTWDRVVLKLPLVGPILQQRFMAQFLQTLATLVSSGVVLLNGITLVRNATGNTYIRAILDGVALQVGEGASLSRCMKKNDFFPPVAADIVAIGEQTGNIAEALQRGASRYDKEFNAQIQRLTVLIQPLTIFVVAVFVGVIAYSMITGILTTVSGLRMR